MRNLFNSPKFDASAINKTIQNALASAGLDTSQGSMRQLTETIQRALNTSGATSATLSSAREGEVIDVVATVIPTGINQGSHDLSARGTSPKRQPGTFETHEFHSHAGTRAYKLYIPARPLDTPPPLVVMLHGCTQSADDFSAGTQMNRLAEEHGFLVAYPEQAAHANSSKCWNWFKPQDQLRDSGEPSLIAGIVREVVSRHDADSRRVFVAGLSAGAAMAVVMGETYRDLFAGVGVHSGLPFGSAHDIPSAMAAMKGGRSGMPQLKGTIRPTMGFPDKVVQPMPTIVFHGDRDHTVQHTNASEIVRQAKNAYLAQDGGEALCLTTYTGKAPGGRAYKREVYATGSGRAHIESWTLHGAGHAWSGGHAGGSYTDRTGPDASSEMIRFFLALALAHAGAE